MSFTGDVGERACNISRRKGKRAVRYGPGSALFSDVNRTFASDQSSTVSRTIGFSPSINPLTSPRTSNMCTSIDKKFYQQRQIKNDALSASFLEICNVVDLYYISLAGLPMLNEV